MTFQTLRIGSKGPAVLKWERFLRGRDLLVEREVDENYTEATHKATWRFQEIHGLFVDGVAGNNTQTYAMEQLNFERVTPKVSEDWPQRPKGLKPISSMERPGLFGDIKFVPAPVKGNPEGIKITNNWNRDNLGSVVIPQLKGVIGAPSSGKIFFHKKAIPQLVAMFQAWEDAGLNDRIISWAGSWAPRFIRGSRTTLSNHSWATAFDINVPWNGLNRTPAQVGEQGSVRELVDIAVDHGFFWGGWFGMSSGSSGSSKGRDGMHFEVCKFL